MMILIFLFFSSNLPLGSSRLLSAIDTNFACIKKIAAVQYNMFHVCKRFFSERNKKVSAWNSARKYFTDSRHYLCHQLSWHWGPYWEIIICGEWVVYSDECVVSVWRSLLFTKSRTTKWVYPTFLINLLFSLYRFTAIQQYASGNSVAVLVGNKCELNQRAVSTEQAEALANQLGLRYLETSAKDNINVKETFDILIDASVANVESFIEVSGEPSVTPHQDSDPETPSQNYNCPTCSIA